MITKLLIDPNTLEKEPTWGDLYDASMRQSNLFFNAPSEVSYPSEPDFSFRDYMPAGYEDYEEEFAWATSPEEVKAIQKAIDQELADKKILAESPWKGLVTTAFAAATSPEQLPLYFVPALNLIKGTSLARAIGQGAKVGAVSAGASELVLQQVQRTRALQESVFNVGGSAIFGGVLSGIGAGLGESSRALRNLDLDMQLIDSNPVIPDMTPSFTPDGKITPEFEQAVTTSVDRWVYDGLIKPEDREAMIASQIEWFKRTETKLRFPKLYRTLGWYSPAIRMMTPSVHSARNFASKLVLSPLQRLNNKFGHAEIPVEVQMDQLVDAHITSMMGVVDGRYKEYKTNTPPGQRLSRDDFLAEITEAMANGDVHENIHIAQAAKELRSDLDEFQGRLLDQGLIDGKYSGFDELTWDDIKDLPGIKEEDRLVYFKKNGSPRKTIEKALKAEHKELLTNSGVLSKDVANIFPDEGFVHRLFDRRIVYANRENFINEIQAIFSDYAISNFVNQLDELEALKSALLAKIQGRGKAKTVSKANQATLDSLNKQIADIREAVRLISTDPDHNDLLMEAARKAYNSVVYGIYKTGAKIGKVEVQGLHFSLNDIPYSKLSKWLKKNPTDIWHHYYRLQAPKLVLKENFGDINASAILKKVADDYDKAISEAPPGQRRRLQKERDQFMRDSKAIIDMHHDRYGRPDDPNSLLYKTGQALRIFNMLTKLGGMLIASFSDPAYFIARQGFRVFNAPKFFTGAGRQWSNEFAERIGTAVDLVNSKRMAGLAFVDDRVASPSAFQRFMDTYTPSKVANWTAKHVNHRSITNKFLAATGMTLWNTELKKLVGAVFADSILTDARRLASLSAKDLRRYATAGLEKTDLEQIAKYSTGRFLDLDDLPEDLAQKVAQVVYQEAELTIFAPSRGDLPLASRSELGKLIFQFKAFALTANHKVLMSTIDDFSLRKVVGFASALAFGYLSYLAREVGIKGKEYDEKEAMKKAIINSGYLTWFQDAHALIEKASMGNISVDNLIDDEDEPLSNYDFNSFAGILLGPSFSTMKDAYRVLQSGAFGEMETRDYRALKRLVPLNNHFLLQGILSKMDED